FFLLLVGSVHGDGRALHSFPTRRSSDLPGQEPSGGVGDGAGECERQRDAGLVEERQRRVDRRLGVQRVEHGLDQEQVETVFDTLDRKSTRLNSSHVEISYAVFCLKKKKK